MQRNVYVRECCDRSVITETLKLGRFSKRGALDKNEEDCILQYLNTGR